MATAPVANVARFLPARAAQQPAALALRAPRGRARRTGAIRYLDLTFAELEAETNAWAHRLAAAGVTRGTRTLLLVPPGLALVALPFALFKIGAVPVVIDPGMGLRAFLRGVARTRPAAVVAVRRGVLVSHLFRRAFPDLRARVAVAPQRLLTRGRAGASRRPVAPHPAAATTADELAAILFTSGSTGPAKGVCYTHGMFEAQVRLIRDTYEIAPGEVDLPLLPVFALFNPALGLTTVVPEINPARPATADPARIVQAITQCGVTNSFGSPVLWRKIADHCRQHRRVLPTLRRVLMAGAPVPPALMRDVQALLPGGTAFSPYGATEALPVASVSAREILEFAAARSLAGGGTCVGRPVAETRVRILPLAPPASAPAGAAPSPLAPGALGEIQVCGPQVTRTYDGLPEATAASKVTDGAQLWHRMGDAGYVDDAGRLWFCGRIAERVPTPDGDLFTECVEPVFNQHPRIARCALIGRAAGPALVVEPHARDWPRTARARAALAAELRELGRACAPAATIRDFFFLRRLPVDVRHNAKIHRLALARRFAGTPPVHVP